MHQDHLDRRAHHHAHERHDHELFHRVMPYIERLHMMHEDISHMSIGQLDRLVERVMRDSGVLHPIPHGFTEQSLRDSVRDLLLDYADGDYIDAMAPFVPLAFGPGFFPQPFPFFFPVFPFRRGPHRRPHHGRPGGRGRGRR